MQELLQTAVQQSSVENNTTDRILSQPATQSKGHVQMSSKVRKAFAAELLKEDIDKSLADGIVAAVSSTAYGVFDSHIINKKHVMREKAKQLATILKVTRQDRHISNEPALHKRSGFIIDHFVTCVFNFLQKYTSVQDVTSAKETVRGMLDAGFTYRQVGNLMTKAPESFLCSSRTKQILQEIHKLYTTTVVLAFQRLNPLSETNNEGPSSTQNGLEVHLSGEETSKQKDTEASVYRLGTTVIEAVLRRCKNVNYINTTTVESVRHMTEIMKHIMQVNSIANISDITLLVERPEPDLFNIRIVDVEKMVYTFNNRLTAEDCKSHIQTLQHLLWSQEFIDMRLERGNVLTDNVLAEKLPRVFEDSYRLASCVLYETTSPRILYDELHIKKLVEGGLVSIGSEEEKFLWQQLIRKQNAETENIQGSYESYRRIINVEDSPQSTGTDVLDCLSLIKRPEVM